MASDYNASWFPIVFPIALRLKTKLLKEAFGVFGDLTLPLSDLISHPTPSCSLSPAVPLAVCRACIYMAIA